MDFLKVNRIVWIIPIFMIKVFCLLDYPRVTQLFLGCWSMYSLLGKNNQIFRKRFRGTKKFWRKKNISIYFEAISVIATNLLQRQMKNANISRNPTSDRNVLQISEAFSLEVICFEHLIFQNFIKISSYTVLSYPVI